MLFRWSFFIGYLVIVYLIGYWSYKQTKGLSEFYVAGKDLGIVPLVGTFAASFVSASSILGYVAFSYGNGWSLITIYGIGCACGWTLLGFVSDRLRNFEAGVTSPDIYAVRYYNPKMRLWTAIVFIVWQSLFLMQQFMGVGYTIEQFLGIPYKVGLVIIGITMVIYVTSGGMRSVVWTDVVQAVVMLTGVLIAAIAVIKLGGGLSAINSSAMEIVTEARPRGFMLDALGGGQFTVSHILIESFALAAVICCVPFYHRMFFSARDGKLARGTIGLATPILILFYICLAILGVAARVMMPELEAVDRAFPSLVDKVLPPFLGTLVLTCIVAGIMSTLDSLLLAVGSMVSHDIYAGFINKKATEEQEMKVTRWALVIVGLGGMFLSFNPPATIMEMYHIMINVVSSTLFPPLILGLFWKRATYEGAMIGSITGFVSSWLWMSVGSKALPPAGVGIPLAIVVTILVSYLTPEPPQTALAPFFPSRSDKN